jgi:hypothetical protein
LLTSTLLLRRVGQLHAMTASTASIDSLTFARPDDWHLHVRDGAMLAAVLPDTARQFGRAIIMPNLNRRSRPRQWRRLTASASSRRSRRA